VSFDKNNTILGINIVTEDLASELHERCRMCASEVLLYDRAHLHFHKPIYIPLTTLTIKHRS